MREPRTRVEASTRRHENAMKPSPMTVGRDGMGRMVEEQEDEGASKRRGIVDGERERVAEFSQPSPSTPSCHGLRLREFSRGLKNFDCLVKD